MLDMRVKAPELLDVNTVREAGMKSNGPKLSDVARALMRPKDPKIRRTL